MTQKLKQDKIVGVFCHECNNNKTVVNIHTRGIECLCAECGDALFHMSIGKGHTEKLLNCAGLSPEYDGFCTHAYCEFREVEE